MILYYIPVYGLLAVTCYMDFRFHRIYFWVFPALFVFIFLLSAQVSTTYVTAVNFVLNFAFGLAVLLTSMGLTTFVLKKRMDQLLGLGDILMLLCIGIFFDPISFMIFFILSCSAALVLHFMLMYANVVRRENGVPLAGYHAILFGIGIPLGQYNTFGLGFLFEL